MPAYTWATGETITAAKLNALESEAWQYLNILAADSTTSEQGTTFSSTAYFDINPAVTFTPKTTSVFVAIMGGGAFVGNAGYIGTVGIRVNGVDYDVSHWRQPAETVSPTASCGFAGGALITGLTAGTSYTAQARLKVNASGTTVALNRGGSSRVTVLVIGIGK